MDFADRLAEVLYDAWGMKVTGSFAAAGGVVFNAGISAAPSTTASALPEVLLCSRQLIGAFSTNVYFSTMETLCAVDTVSPN